MQFIKLTLLNDNKPIYINITQIGHMYEVETKYEYNRIKKEKHTRMGVTTHNNGGFEIVENISQIMKLIEKAK